MNDITVAMYKYTPGKYKVLNINTNSMYLCTLRVTSFYNVPIHTLGEIMSLKYNNILCSPPISAVFGGDPVCIAMYYLRWPATAIQIGHVLSDHFISNFKNSNLNTRSLKSNM